MDDEPDQIQHVAREYDLGCGAVIAIAIICFTILTALGRIFVHG